MIQQDGFGISSSPRSSCFLCPGSPGSSF